MRRYVRTFAAGIVIILGLALMSAAAFNSDTGRISLPVVNDEPKDETYAKPIPPFNPETGVSKHAGIPQSLRPDAFESEFGKRGKHKVEVRVIGGDQYAITWRDNPETEWGTGNGAQRTRTINSGFPVVRVAVNGAARTATCVITVDGQERDRQSSTDTTPIVVCEA
jgi:hypothetical protein